MEILDKEKQTFFEETRNLVEGYVEDRILLFKLQTGEKIAKMVSSFYIMFIIGLLLFVILMILTVIAGYFLAFLTDNFIVGFGIVAVIYVILIFIIYSMHKKFLGKRVMNNVIKLLFENKEETNAV
jgi:polyferredoxin